MISKEKVIEYLENMHDECIRKGKSIPFFSYCRLKGSEEDRRAIVGVLNILKRKEAKNEHQQKTD